MRPAGNEAGVCSLGTLRRDVATEGFFISFLRRGRAALPPVPRPQLETEMTQQSSHTSAVRIDGGLTDGRCDPCDAMATRLRVAGRRGAAPTLIGEALASYWPLVALTDSASRARVLRGLHDEIADGRTTARACVPVALGDPDFEVARDATLVYVGGWPASVDRRSHVVDEVLDWIVRGLALNRAALACALLERADATCVQRLGCLRGRLEAREADVVFAALRDRELDGEVATFVEEWRSMSRAAGDSVAARGGGRRLDAAQPVRDFARLA